MHPDPELSKTWSAIDAKLEAAVDEATYRIWLAPLTLLALDGAAATIAAPPHAAAWVRERFGRLLQTAVAAVAGADVGVDVVSDEGARRHETAPAGLRRATAAPAGSGTAIGPELFTSPKLTFQQFVIGDCNRLAHAAALTVAEMPANAYNPLFICGPPGVGKTHLLGAIRALVLAHDPTLVVRCLTGEQFTNEFLHALSGGHTDVFKARYRHADVLLIDDVQFLERKARTEEEFFHTFNALYEAGSQLVLTSDRPPANLDALEDRLRERFASGLVADVSPPDRTTRLTILRKRVDCDGIELADERALHVIAERVRANVRALEGALIRVVAFASLTRRPITVELAEEVLGVLYAGTGGTERGGLRAAGAAGTTSLAAIQEAACSQFGITADELLSPSRRRRVAWPRQVAMYLARELTDESLPAIGRHFGGRDHTTVMHACRRTAKAIHDDTELRAAVEKLASRLSGNPC